VSKPKVYIDACPLIDLVKHRLQMHSTDDRQMDAWFTDRLIQAAKLRKIDLFTSTLTIAECTHVQDEKKDKETQPFFLGLLASGKSGFALVQPTVTIAEQARNLRWLHGLALKGADAIHVASALAMKCDGFITTDEKGFLKRAEGLAKLNLRVCRPSDTKLLPPEFLQENLPLS
jgi:predicted nucleic acid-binding protein